MPKQVKVNLFGKTGHRQTEVTQRGFTTRHVRTRQQANQTTETLSIAKNPPKPEPVIPAFSKAWTANRDRLLAYLSVGFHGNLSTGIILHELGTAIETQYAPRKAMNPQQWRAFTADLQTPDYNNVQWIAGLQAKISRKFQDRRPPLTTSTTTQERTA